MTRVLRLSSVLAALTIAVLLPAGATPSWSASQVVDGTWSALDPAQPAPYARREFTAVYDAAADRYVIFGGASYGAPDPSSLLLEVWELRLGANPTWAQLAVANGPGGRHNPQWGYDRANNRILLFGGYGRRYPGSEPTYLNDVWQLTLDGTPTWTELFPTGTPPTGRLAGAAVYDPFRLRFVGFGGTVGLPTDTWELDLSGAPEWKTVTTHGQSPPGSYGMFSICDPVGDRMLIFGGSTSDAYFGTHNDLWELHLRGQSLSWHQLNPAGELPQARRTGTSIYDPLRKRMVLYGGWNGTPNPDAFLGDTWALSLNGNLEWTELSPGGEVPGVRDALTAAYDPSLDRMVVFGGWSGSNFLNDTHFLNWGGSGQAASLTATSEAEPDVARIEWDVQDATGTLGAVYRRTPGGAWESIAEIEADASGNVLFEDHNVVPGARYGYQIVMPSEQGEAFGGEEWVDVPTAAGVTPTTQAFALNRVSPNPVVDRFTVSFALPTAEPARLELMDLSGRRVFSREVGSLGAGSHQLELGSARTFAPGMYFFKLSQASRSATSRVVIQSGH